jgi:hypothetical protein
VTSGVFDFPRRPLPKRLVKLKLDPGFLALIDRWREGRRIPRTKAIRECIALCLAGEMLGEGKGRRVP